MAVGARGQLRIPRRLQSVPGEGGGAGQRTAADVARPRPPEKPATLPADLHRAWDEMVSALDEAGLIARCDGLALELALRHHQAAVQASNELAASGSVSVEDRQQGRLAKHPADQTFRGQSLAFLEFAKELGTTFVARARTPLPDAEQTGAKNPFA